MSYIGTKPADAVLRTQDISDGIVTNPKLSTGSQQNFRNIVINGDMSIAQRGTSASSITSSGGYETIDRYNLQLDTAGTWTQSQSTDVPTGQGFAKSLKMDCTTANSSLSAGSLMYINQRFEGQNLQYIKKGTSSAESLTLSFWVKSNKTGTYIVQFLDTDNSRSNSQSYTISSADTWEKKTITFAGDTSGVLNNDSAESLRVIWWLVAGSTYSSGTLGASWGSTVNANRAVGQVNLADSTSNEWYVTAVQLEVGAASDFEHIPFQNQLNACQRYYYQTYDYGTASGTATYTGVPQRFTDNGSNFTSLQIFHPVPMRSAPSIVVFNPVTGGTGSGTTDSNVNKDIAAIQISQKYAHLHASDTTINKSASIRCHITANSEL
tara:strand:+ start:695 stop:1834 length:1140 start_codon:yes stop_codon:yes gene_type:complete